MCSGRVGIWTSTVDVHHDHRDLYGDHGGYHDEVVGLRVGREDHGAGRGLRSLGASLLEELYSFAGEGLEQKGRHHP